MIKKRLCHRPYGDELDAVYHLMCFALDLLTLGGIEIVVDAEYINSSEWYHSLPKMLSSEADEDGVPARGEDHLGFVKRPYTAEGV